MRNIFLFAVILQILFLSFYSEAQKHASRYQEEEDDYWPCTKPGLMCSSCSQISLCEQSNDGKWNQTILERCELESTCLDSTVSCTKDYNPQCEMHADIYYFQCHQIGLFPDPFDCRYFHMCSYEDDTSKKHKCPSNFFYDPLSTRCVIKATKEKCPPPVAPCRQTSQGPILGNSRLHYMCLPDGRDRYYFPHLYYCNDNYKYIDGVCADPDKPQGLIDGKCEKIGVFYNPDCLKYNTCLGAGQDPQHIPCPQNNYFDINAKICLPIKCHGF